MILIFLHIILDFLRYYKKNLHAAENFLPGAGEQGIRTAARCVRGRKTVRRTAKRRFPEIEQVLCAQRANGTERGRLCGAGKAHFPRYCKKFL